MSDTQKLFTESGTSPPLRVTVTRVLITPGCAVGLGEGFDECGRVVSFAEHLGVALAAGHDVEVTLEAWQVLGGAA